MASLNEVKQFRQRMFDESMALVEKKGHDYNRAQQAGGDTLFNLRVCELLGIVPTVEAGILVRLSDKFMRLISLTAPGVEAAVKDESVLDTVRDIHNYVDYLALEWQKRRNNGGSIVQPIDDCPPPDGIERGPIIKKGGPENSDIRRECGSDVHMAKALELSDSSVG